MERPTHEGKKLRHFASLPFIYMIVLPLIILDAFFEIYHRIAFRLFGIPLVQRNLYIIIDRHKLSYLTYVQRINCLYCGYANGLLAYVKEIASRTENYWCAIRHQHEFEEDEQYADPAHMNFLVYGDKKSFKKW